MKIDRKEIKRQLHLARVNLDYRKNKSKNATPEIIAASQAEVDRLSQLYEDSDPARCTIRVRSPYFIGPRRKRGKRGDGPTIKCFRCEQVKPREEYPAKGTLCTCCVATRAAEWARENPEASKLSKQEWAERNRDTINARGREKYWQDPESERERSKAYNKKYPGRRTEQQKRYIKKRKRSDPRFRALLTCKRRMWILFASAGVKKTLKSSELLGIDRNGFFAHLESLFLPGMTWNNRGLGRGKWHIDHIVPCSSFDMTDPAQAKACWHYTNLRPLWAEDNWAKGDKIIVDHLSDEKMGVVATVE